jgi:hypothetical protein
MGADFCHVEPAPRGESYEAKIIDRGGECRWTSSWVHHSSSIPYVMAVFGFDRDDITTIEAK